MTDPTGVTLVPLGEADGRDRWTVEHDDRVFVVFVRAGGLVVSDALCPHRRIPLVDGVIRDGAIVCPGHWYAYDLASGLCRTTDAYDLTLYPVVEVDGAAYAEIPPLAPPLSWAERLRAHATARAGSDPADESAGRRESRPPCR
jgi:nitrite reductase/ring-hydroxylating ferredoxin subunit